MPDGGAIFEYRANYYGVKMAMLKLLGRNPRSIELFQEI